MSGTDDEWEYETLRPPRGPTKKEAIDPKGQLNELGGNGWELVTTVEYVGGGTKYMVFKRPTSENTNVSGSADTDAEGTENESEHDDGEEADTDDRARSERTTDEGNQ